MRIIKKIGISICSIISVSIFTNNINLIDFYKPFALPEYTPFYHDIVNPEKIMGENDIRTVIDLIDYCSELPTEKKRVCYVTLSRSGYADAIKGIAEMHFDKFLTSQKEDEVVNSLIMTAKTLGMAEGFQGIELKYSALYPSFRMSYSDFIERDEIVEINNNDALKSYFLLGVIKSLEFEINKNHFEKSENPFEFESLALEIDLSENEKESIRNGIFSPILSELRESLDNPTGINFFVRQVANNNYASIFNSLLNGENTFPQETNLSIYALYDLGVKKKDDDALYYLISYMFRKSRMSDDAEIITALEDNIIKLSSLLVHRNSSFENQIFNFFLDRESEDTDSLINFVRKVNGYRKHAAYWY